MGKIKDVESLLRMVEMVKLDSGDVEYSKKVSSIRQKRQHLVNMSYHQAAIMLLERN